MDYNDWRRHAPGSVDRSVDRKSPRSLAGAVEAFTSRDGLTNDFVHSILQDREGNIWVGTASGLDRFQKTNLVPISLPIPAQTANSHRQ